MQTSWYALVSVSMHQCYYLLKLILKIKSYIFFFSETMYDFLDYYN